jgi:hypothetical protein
VLEGTHQVDDHQQHCSAHLRGLYFVTGGALRKH